MWKTLKAIVANCVHIGEYSELEMSLLLVGLKFLVMAVS